MTRWSETRSRVEINMVAFAKGRRYPNSDIDQGPFVRSSVCLSIRPGKIMTEKNLQVAQTPRVLRAREQAEHSGVSFLSYEGALLRKKTRKGMPAMLNLFADGNKGKEGKEGSWGDQDFCPSPHTRSRLHPSENKETPYSDSNTWSLVGETTGCSLPYPRNFARIRPFYDSVVPLICA